MRLLPGGTFPSIKLRPGHGNAGKLKKSLPSYRFKHVTTYPAAMRVGRCSTSATDKRIGTIEIRSYIIVKKWLCTQLLQGFPFSKLKNVSLSQCTNPGRIHMFTPTGCL